MAAIRLERDDSYTGPTLVEAMVEAAERELGVKLPRTYIDVLSNCNGGIALDPICRTSFGTSWDESGFEISAILGIGGVYGIDSTSEVSSQYLISEWHYPPVGVVIALTPSGGHDTVMLDYRNARPGRPAVVYVDEDRNPRRVADSFEEFADALVAEWP